VSRASVESGVALALPTAATWLLAGWLRSKWLPDESTSRQKCLRILSVMKNRCRGGPLQQRRYPGLLVFRPGARVAAVAGLVSEAGAVEAEGGLFAGLAVRLLVGGFFLFVEFFEAALFSVNLVPVQFATMQLAPVTTRQQANLLICNSLPEQKINTR
jgi:hypothetical protein